MLAGPLRRRSSFCVSEMTFFDMRRGAAAEVIAEAEVDADADADRRAAEAEAEEAMVGMLYYAMSV